MHEYGLAEGVVDAVLQRAQGRPVTGVRVRAGVRQRLVPESMQQAFTSVAAGSVAEHAVVELETVPVDVRCRDCARSSPSMDPFAVCPQCGSEDVDVTGGEELILVSVSLSAGSG